MENKLLKVESFEKIPLRDLNRWDTVVVDSPTSIPQVLINETIVDDVYYQCATSTMSLRANEWGKVDIHHTQGAIPCLLLPDGSTYASTFMSQNGSGDIYRGHKSLYDCIRINMGDMKMWNTKKYLKEYIKGSYYCQDSNLGKLSYDLMVNFSDIVVSDDGLHTYFCFKYPEHGGYLILAFEQEIEIDRQKWNTHKTCYIINSKFGIYQVRLNAHHMFEHIAETLMTKTQKEYYTQLMDAANTISVVRGDDIRLNAALDFMKLDRNSLNSFFLPLYERDGYSFYRSDIHKYPKIVCKFEGDYQVIDDKWYDHSRYIEKFFQTRGKEGFNPLDGEMYEEGAVVNYAGYTFTEHGIKITDSKGTEYFTKGKYSYAFISKRDDPITEKIDKQAKLINKLQL